MNPFGYSRFVRHLPLLGLLPTVILYLVFGVGPSIATALFSFTDITGTPGLPWHWVGWLNYYTLYVESMNPFNSDGLGIIIWRTIIYAIISTFVQNGIALGLALILNTKLKGHVFYRAVIFMPAILGVTVIGLSWGLIFSPLGGPAEAILHLFGGNSSFLGDNNWAFPIIIFISIWSSVGGALLIWLAGLQSIPAELNEAATIDGASSWTLFRYVTFPLLASATSINVLLAVIGALQTYGLTYILTKGQYRTTTLGMAVYNAAFGSGNEGRGAALSMVMFVLVLFVALILNFYMRRREARLI